MIIAIDGPAGSGKSSTARAIADRLGGLYLDTGAMYRAVGVALARAGVTEAEAVSKQVTNLRIDIVVGKSDVSILVDGDDVTREIRTAQASVLASGVSRLLPVRRRLVSEQRRIGRELSAAGRLVVVEGRDIGTVVFPDADVKFFMDADPTVRARRRHQELRAWGQEEDFQSVLSDLEVRDRLDREREHSPLRKAEDAIIVDTSRLTPEEQVDIILAAIAERYEDVGDGDS